MRIIQSYYENQYKFPTHVELMKDCFVRLFFTLPLAQCAGRSLQRPDISKALEKLNCNDKLVGVEFLYNHRPFDTKLVH